jgi:hypothetical protein
MYDKKAESCFWFGLKGIGSMLLARGYLKDLKEETDILIMSKKLYLNTFQLLEIGANIFCYKSSTVLRFFFDYFTCHYLGLILGLN